MALSRPIYIVAAKRTAFGAFGGKFKDVSATVLGEKAASATIAAANLDPCHVKSVIFGNVIQSSSDAAYLARHIGLQANVPIEATALTVNRLCGSGFQAVINAAQEIILGDADIVLAGGSENMSQAPFAIRNSRWGINLGEQREMEDTLWSGLTDSYINTPMGVTAENLAEKYSTTRLECDEFALSSQDRWAKAHQDGVFSDEIAPVEVKIKRKTVVVDTDEHPRVGVTLEQLQKLPPVFKKNGTVAAGNASGICDGAAALLVASEEACKKHNLAPLARIVSYGVSGVDPSIMGIGPCPAIKTALKNSNKSLSDMALVEVNEAFAAQYLAVEKELGLDRSITNTNGGAIALGHPLGTSGARILTHLTHALRRTGEQYAVGSACIGGGQGIAVVLENMK
ncbi:3-ketoacyl-CoA thiolase, mitochondrial-like [Hydractinia symbiolongicarpus]|uniref:3-ketoacyl-CoA thiolase, mitochondrial-like n=1 Tax=Hydractinia symbiolongicarpus TaxID=13093 RepID=UPI00254A468E|nr:3-ketoacyl-CoA thiolase, mitochondrial-like [Hydractinia symbiolongicarpus]